MSKTVEQLQAAVDEIRAVCLKHGVMLVGTCDSEGIFGEITIYEPDEPLVASNLRSLHGSDREAHKRLSGDERNGYSVPYIGELAKAPIETTTWSRELLPPMPGFPRVLQSLDGGRTWHDTLTAPRDSTR